MDPSNQVRLCSAGLIFLNYSTIFFNYQLIIKCYLFKLALVHSRLLYDIHLHIWIFVIFVTWLIEYTICSPYNKLPYAMLFLVKLSIQWSRRLC